MNLLLLIINIYIICINMDIDESSINIIKIDNVQTSIHNQTASASKRRRFLGGSEFSKFSKSTEVEKVSGSAKRPAWARDVDFSDVFWMMFDGLSMDFLELCWCF